MSGGLEATERRLFQTEVNRLIANPVSMLTEADLRLLWQARNQRWDRGQLAAAVFNTRTVNPNQQWQRLTIAFTQSDQTTDMVEHPKHYEDGPFECIELTERYSCCLSNAIRYVYRHKNKWNPIEDLHKANWYVDRAIQRFEQFTPIDGIDATPPLGKQSTFDMLDQLVQLNWADASKFWLGLLEENPAHTKTGLTELIAHETEQH